jgi:hypothetical protein
MVAPAAAAAPGTGMPPPGSGPAAGGGGSAMKVLFVVLGVVFVFAAIAAAGIAYLGFKAKDKIESVAREYGVDPSRPRGPSARRVEVCSLLTKDEAAEILGVAIERIEPSGDAECHYFGKAPTQEEREREMARLQSSLEKSKARGKPEEIENLTKALMSGMAGGAGPSFSISVDWEEGRTMIGAMKFVTGTAGTEEKMSEPLRGIGDEAILGPMNSILMFRKGATGVQVDLRMVPDGRERGIAIAKIVEGRLRM